MIPDLTTLSYEERLTELNLPTLEYRRKRGDIISTFKIIHGIDDIQMEAFFEFSHNTSTRGHSLKLTKPRGNKSIRINYFAHRVINTWNIPSRKYIVFRHSR